MGGLCAAVDRKLYEKLINSVAPSIYGYDKVKEAILLQLVGGVKKIRNIMILKQSHL